MGMLYCIVITLLAQTNNNITILCLVFGFMHRCQPLRFFRNCYEFRVKITVLRSTVYLLRISDYCRPGTISHLNIIVII